MTRTRPTVLSVTPANNSTSVSRTVSPTATFSEAMNPATVTTSTVRLRRGSTSGTIVTATVLYNPATRVVTVDPVATLASNTTYTVVISAGSSGVKDLGGNSLAATYSWTFRTRSSRGASVVERGVAHQLLHLVRRLDPADGAGLRAHDERLGAWRPRRGSARPSRGRRR